MYMHNTFAHAKQTSALFWKIKVVWYAKLDYNCDYSKSLSLWLNNVFFDFGME